MLKNRHKKELFISDKEFYSLLVTQICQKLMDYLRYTKMVFRL